MNCGGWVSPYHSGQYGGPQITIPVDPGYVNIEGSATAFIKKDHNGEKPWRFGNELRFDFGGAPFHAFFQDTSLVGAGDLNVGFKIRTIDYDDIERRLRLHFGLGINLCMGYGCTHDDVGHTTRLYLNALNFDYEIGFDNTPKTTPQVYDGHSWAYTPEMSVMYMYRPYGMGLKGSARLDYGFNGGFSWNEKIIKVEGDREIEKTVTHNSDATHLAGDLEAEFFFFPGFRSNIWLRGFMFFTSYRHRFTSWKSEDALPFEVERSSANWGTILMGLRYNAIFAKRDDEKMNPTFFNPH